MKKSFFLFLLIAVNAMAQTHTDVVNVEGKTKSELYNQALEWVAVAFRSANDVIQFKDLETGKIVCKGLLQSKPVSMGVVTPGSTSFVLTISLKDDKYKYEVSDISFTPHYNTNPLAFNYETQPKKYQKIHTKWKSDVDIEINTMIKDMLHKMSNTTSADW
jgi:hypothetical protein